MSKDLDTSMLAAALMGYRSQLDHVNGKIEEIRSRLGGRKVAAFIDGMPKRKHRISAAGRARIAEAQRKRWAKARKAK